jgi:phosphoadenosine phosphosulfate reductase
MKGYRMALSQSNIETKAVELESMTAPEVIQWALSTYHPKIVIASSFGAEDVALIDMAVRIEPKVRVLTLDTGRLNQETYDVMDSVRRKYNIQIEVYFPDAKRVEMMVREKGLNLFYDSLENRLRCCGLRKVEPLNRALGAVSAWLTGLRREQSVTRGAVKKLEWDADHGGGIAKINPLADWKRDQVWNYIRKNDVPYNKLHDQNYLSIGCAPCTRAVKPGEGERAGRWWWENPEHKECGLHVKS